jgi:hypothetical protein
MTKKCLKNKSKHGSVEPRLVGYDCDGLSIEWLEFEFNHLALDLYPDGLLGPISNGFAFAND